jgi:hypothetical protein
VKLHEGKGREESFSFLDDVQKAYRTRGYEAKKQVSIIQRKPEKQNKKPDILKSLTNRPLVQPIKPAETNSKLV